MDLKAGMRCRAKDELDLCHEQSFRNQQPDQFVPRDVQAKLCSNMRTTADICMLICLSKASAKHTG